MDASSGGPYFSFVVAGIWLAVVAVMVLVVVVGGGGCGCGGGGVGNLGGGAKKLLHLFLVFVLFL